MDTLASLAGLALAIVPPIVIGLGIRALGGTDDPADTLPGFFAPLVGPSLDSPARSHPIVREEEMVRWRLDGLGYASPAPA
jgi:hypothetical protein